MTRKIHIYCLEDKLNNLIKYNKHFSKVIKYPSLRKYMCTVQPCSRAGTRLRRSHSAFATSKSCLPKVCVPATSTSTRTSQCNKTWEINNFLVFNKRNRIFKCAWFLLPLQYPFQFFHSYSVKGKQISRQAPFATLSFNFQSSCLKFLGSWIAGIWTQLEET